MSVNDEPTNVCCICLEEEDIKNCLFVDKIRHIPCNCNVYAHKICFSKTDQINCLVCHNRYQVSWNQYQRSNYKRYCSCNHIKIYLKYKLRHNIITFLSNMRNSENEYIKKCYYFFEFLIGFTITIFIIWFFLLIGGYFFNAIICLLFYDYIKTDLCWLKPSQPLLYLFGVLGMFIAIYCFGFFSLCCILIRRNSDTYRIVPIV
jgi:hypothetical protein